MMRALYALIGGSLSILATSQVQASDTCYALMLVPNSPVIYDQNGNYQRAIQDVVPTPKFIYGYQSLDLAKEAKDNLQGEDAADKASRLAYEASPQYAVDQKLKAQEAEKQNVLRAQRELTYCKSHDCSKGYNDWEHYPLMSVVSNMTVTTGYLLPYRQIKIFPAPCDAKTQ